uniref:Endonuclease/exonuclease/phosphatase domain-containing protein n=1 Tax=Micrurus spixii TaxID=129469 RepID=A0A2D4LIQ1_9SAUR
MFTDHCEIHTGGGVAIFYKKSLYLKNIQITQELALPETIVCELSLNITFRLLLCYRAPDYDIEHVNKLNTLLTWAASCPHTFIFLGDFDLPHINWTLNECTTEPIHATFYNAVTNLGLE